MAIIKMSNMGITAISGKAGGSVYSRNRGGEYFKNFVMPTNSFSEARQAVRAVFGAVSSGWRGLTQQMRNSWIENAPLYLRTNAFGDQKQLSPNALYVAQNQNLANADLPLINTIGAPEGANGISGIFDAFIVDIGAGNTIRFGYRLRFNNSLFTTPNQYVLEGTPPHSPSVRSIENKFRVLATTASHSGPPVASLVRRLDFVASGPGMLALYTNKFGTPKVGDVVSIRLKAVNPSTGEVSAYWQDSTTVIST